MSKNEVAEKEAPTTIKGFMQQDHIQAELALALPQHIKAERFMRVALTALGRTPKLQECTTVSFYKCMLDLASLGIEADGRRAHLIPYGKECTLILDYKGKVELMRRSGDVVKIHSDIVCDNDVFEHNKGEISLHNFDFRDDRGSMIAAYTEVTLKDGSTQSAIMSKKEIDGIRARSKAGKSGPWVTDYNEMAKKTTLHRVSKLLTLSPEIHELLGKDQEFEFNERNVTPRARKKPLDMSLPAPDEVLEPTDAVAPEPITEDIPDLEPEPEPEPTE